MTESTGESSSIDFSMKPGDPTPEGLVCLNDIEREAVTWVWDPYLPRGKLTLLEGDPGLGKSWISLAIASSISRGEKLGQNGLDQAANCLILSAEDGHADTIKPRLEVLLADQSKLFAPKDLFTLNEPGLSLLDHHLIKLKPALLVIDPVVAYVGRGVDLNRANEIREITSRLAELARNHNCAILCLRHLSKGSKDKAIYRGQGSIDWTASARSVLLVGCDPNNKSRRAIIHIKSNLAQSGPSQGYSINDGRFEWTGESTLTERQVLAPEREKTDSALRQAEEFLCSYLEGGERPTKEVEAEAQAKGIRPATLKRARDGIGIVSRLQGLAGKQGAGTWMISLPPGAIDAKGSLEAHSLEAQDTNVGGVSALNLAPPVPPREFGEI